MVNELQLLLGCPNNLHVPSSLLLLLWLFLLLFPTGLKWQLGGSQFRRMLGNWGRTVSQGQHAVCLNEWLMHCKLQEIRRCKYYIVYTVFIQLCKQLNKQYSSVSLVMKGCGKTCGRWNRTQAVFDMWKSRFQVPLKLIRIRYTIYGQLTKYS